MIIDVLLDACLDKIFPLGKNMYMDEQSSTNEHTSTALVSSMGRKSSSPMHERSTSVLRNILFHTHTHKNTYNDNSINQLII